MKIYIAHNFAARLELREHLVPFLTRLGHEVTSTWITDDSHVDKLNAKQSALIDLSDIDRADALVLYVDQFGDSPGKGKFLELGYAIAKGKRVYLWGKDDSSVFYHLPQVIRLETWKDFSIPKSHTEPKEIGLGTATNTIL